MRAEREAFGEDGHPGPLTAEAHLHVRSHVPTLAHAALAAAHLRLAARGRWDLPGLREGADGPCLDPDDCGRLRVLASQERRLGRQPGLREDLSGSGW